MSQSIFWQENPVCTEINDIDQTETAIYLMIYEKYDYQYDINGNMVLFNTYHQKVKVIDDGQINMFNKIYISLNNTIEITTIKARSINPDGSVVYFDEKNIKEIKENENSSGYKIFAIDGIQKGADVEFLYERKMYPDFNGRSYFQYRFPVRKGKFEVICPKDMTFDFKVYNATKDFIRKDTLIHQQRYYTFLFDSIESYHEVKYSYYNPLRLRMEYRLMNDLREGNVSLYTWNEAARRIFNMAYYLTKAEEKAIHKFIRKLVISDGLPEEDKILIIEDYLKTNISVQDYVPDEFSRIDFILDKKITDEQGIMRLMVNIFKFLAIDHQIVLTTDRTKIKFDGDFQSWYYLEKYLIFFPVINKYLSPVDPELRVGFVPAYLTATDGLFIENSRQNTMLEITGKIKYISPLSYEKNYNNMLIFIDIDDVNEKAKIKTEMSLNGLAGGYLDVIYQYVEEDRRENFLKGLMENPVGSNKIVKIETREKSEMMANDTINGQNFIIFVEYESASILERAGNKYLFNIGETIGEQVEMYQENERLVDVENDFNRWFYREIILNIPEGYQIKNPDAVNMNIVSERNGEKMFGFESSYSMEGALYKVTINEYYKEIYTDKSLAEEFIRVVNAAADFNKISLILEKK